MAKRRKAPPARKPREAPLAEHALLLRSAQSLGRVIGVLQRQLDDVTRRLDLDPTGVRMNADGSDGHGAKKARKKKTAARLPVRKRVL